MSRRRRRRAVAYASGSFISYNEVVLPDRPPGTGNLTSDSLRPLKIYREADRLILEWSDGYRGAIPLQKLSDACPCASCNDKRQLPLDPLRVLSDKELEAAKPVPVAMPARGAYAYQVVWNDGHDSGIFKLELLRELCEPLQGEPHP